ncbi:MAG: type II 3-dehydroquinate dehydratase [Candidatus Heimdallarchaeota archaeon]|nr:type II 3-dehydroquinate dehydratase [Candidatus Heimdallarchaeota archaeon]
MKIQIINGPNINLIGLREKKIYGDISFDAYLKTLKELYKDVEIEHFQSNIEGEIIDKIQQTGFSYDGIILNAGGYTHTSTAIADAIASVITPVVEAHISNILAREEHRHVSMIAPKCAGSIMGFGLDSYRLAIESLRYIKQLRRE